MNLTPETLSEKTGNPKPHAESPSVAPEAEAPKTVPSGPRPAEADVLPPPKVTPEFNVLCYTLLSLFMVSFSVWLIYTWTNYGNRYAPHAEGWYKGGVRMVEITLVRDDVRNLSCASDIVVEDLHCAFRANLQPFAGEPFDDRVTLRPYNTVDSVPFLGAGLWSSLALTGELPKERFTVVCNYHMLGVVRSVSLRWAENGLFGAVKDALPVGRLMDCVIPR